MEARPDKEPGLYFSSRGYSTVEEMCELTEMPKTWCAHCKELEEPKPTDITDDDEWLDWLDE